MQPNVYKCNPMYIPPFLVRQSTDRVGYTLCCILYTLCIYIVVHFDVYTLGNIIFNIHCVTNNATQCILLATQCICRCNTMCIPNVYWIYIGWHVYIHWVTRNYIHCVTRNTTQCIRVLSEYVCILSKIHVFRYCTCNIYVLINYIFIIFNHSLSNITHLGPNALV